MDREEALVDKSQKYLEALNESLTVVKSQINFLPNQWLEIKSSLVINLCLPIHLVRAIDCTRVTN